jgi:hypothetical protein
VHEGSERPGDVWHDTGAADLLSDSINPYAYCGNDPVNHHDEKGMGMLPEIAYRHAQAAAQYGYPVIHGAISDAATRVAQDSAKGWIAAVEAGDKSAMVSNALVGTAASLLDYENLGTTMLVTGVGGASLGPAGGIGPAVAKTAEGGLAKALSSPMGSARSGLHAAGGSGRGANHLKPDPRAKGQHFTFKTDPQTGKVTGYAEWKPNPQNPSGFDQVKRVDFTGDPHFNKATGQDVPTPHAHEKGVPGGVRPARPDEVPQ